uniref:MIT domain-containing protein n=1 Tax=Haemonchus contortus TaxID=6289 RepID=A0A7I5E596_HAECO|nr:Protein of unknown function DUF1759 domain containing protein [Haemonchus contortus]
MFSYHSVLKSDRVKARPQNCLTGILETHTGLLSFNKETHDIIEVQKLIKKTKASILLEMQKVEEAMDRYAQAIDSVEESHSKSDLLNRAEAHIDAAQRLLDDAHNNLRRLTELKEDLFDSESPKNISSGQCRITLTPIPIPKFGGDIWEWEPFCQCFERSVHSKDIDDMYKMSYLLDALQGAAKESDQ